MTIYKDFRAIKAKNKSDEIAQFNKTRENIEKGVILLSGWYGKNLLTKKQQEKSLTEQKKIAIKKLKAQALARIEQFNKEADEIAQSDQAHEIYINVEWKRSATWGANPFAECWSGGNYTTGRASGCGYDKLSAATAQALNKNKCVLNRLYNAYEKELRKNPRATLRDSIGYGSGYLIPRFEGGVGYSCHRSIFDKLGAKVNEWREGKNFDVIIIKF